MPEVWTQQRSTKQRGETGLILLEETANMSVKKLSFDNNIGFGDVFKIDSIRVVYTTTADAGNRRLALKIQKTISSVDKVFFKLESVQTLAASGTKVFQWLNGVASQMQGLTNLVSTTTSYEPLPECFELYRGCDLVIADIGGALEVPIAEAADDTLIYVMGRVR